MNKHLISTFLIMSLIAINLEACQNTQSNAKNETADAPYYSVTVANVNRSKNVYMDLDIEIPKITYSNNDGSSLIDPINLEIDNKLNNLIDEAKINALNTYEIYLSSAKENARIDKENQINALKSKYENIIGDEEKQLIDNLSNNELDTGRFDFFRSTNSDMIRFRGPDRRVNGFTNTENVIIPGLHNKNIIVVETTEPIINETTMAIDGRPGSIAPKDMSSDFKMSGNFEKPNRSSRSDINYKKSNNSKPFDSIKKPNRSSKSDVETKNLIIENKEKVISTESFVKKELTKELTIEDFYRDLEKVKRIRIPDDFSLAFQYIPTTIKCSFEVKCLDEDYLSLFVEIKESRTTSTIKRLFYNIDLNNKKIMDIKDILGENYKEKCIKAISTGIEKWTEEQKETLIDNYNIENYINEETPFFINNNHKAVVQIEKFVITIGSTGYHEFQIS